METIVGAVALFGALLVIGWLYPKARKWCDDL